MFLCSTQMKNHPATLQGQLNNVSHAVPHVVSFFCLCSSAVFIGNIGMQDHHMRTSVPVLISHLKRISCYKPIDACGVKKGGVLSSQWHKNPEQSPCLLFSAQPGEVRMPGLICAACATLFFDYVPGSSLAKAISYFLLPFRERGV